MNTATKKKLGAAAAALILTGALFGTSATAANAYGGKTTTYGISSTHVKAKAAVTVSVKYIKPGAKFTVTVNKKTYTGTASKQATGSIKFTAPSYAGKYSVAVKTPEKKFSTAVTVGTLLKSISEKASKAKKGKNFTLSGALTSVTKTASKSKAPVVITYKVGKKSYHKTVTTSSKGTYSTKLKISKKGTYTITVSVKKSATFTAVSKSIHVKVK